MPSWPTQSDYKDALQNPDTAFRDPDLRASQAERSPMGVPRARSGAFASVYKMTRGTKVVALKLFNFPNPDRAGRYRAVSDHLRSLGRARPAALVGFEYHPEGIRVGKAWYPTLTMDWVTGRSLGEWVRQALDKKTPDLAALRRMADAWGQLVTDLQAARIAHGDLQHDNVMVVGDTPVLVDYDGMCVPALAPADPARRLEQLEFGKPAYQHPGRAAEKLGLHLDHFAAWVILIALRALAADPGLYVRHVLRTDNENLLFCPADMQTPASSRLWPELLRCSDPEVAAWAKMIREALDRPFDQIPPFSLDPFTTLRRLVTALPRDWKAIEAESQRLARAGRKLPPDLAAAVDPFARLRELCRAARPDYAALAAEADALTRAGKALPPELQTPVADAVRRLHCRAAVQKALDARDPRAVKAAFHKHLLDGWVERRLLSDAEKAVQQVEVLDRLRAAAQADDGGRSLVRVWTAEGFLVAGLAEAARYQSEAAAWQARLAAADAFLKAYASPTATEKALADAWAKVTAVGRHPDLKPEHQTRGELAVRRAAVLARLAALPPGASHATDTALLAAWGDGSVLAGCKEAERYIPQVTAARDRLHKVAALKAAIDAADSGTGSESAVVEAAKPLVGYDHPYAARVALSHQSVAALAALRAAVDEKPPSDRAIAAALDHLRATHLDLLKRLDTIDPALAAEAAAAGRRRKALNEFAEIDRTYPEPDQQDRQWQALWVKYKDLLHGRRDTEELRDRLTLAVNRTRACSDLLKCLDAGEMFRLRETYQKHARLLKNYPPVAARQAELQALLTQAGRVLQIRDKLSTTGGTLSDDDLRFLRDHHTAFAAADRQAIVDRVKHRLNTDARLAPGHPPLRVEPAGRGLTVTARWAWAGYGLVSYCLVAVDRDRHLATPDQADPDDLVKCQLPDHTREQGGKRLAPPRGASQVYVTVWAVVELGWTTVHGPPLHLGPAVLPA